MKELLEYITHSRKDYSQNELDEKIISHNPFIQFQCWFEEAIFKKISEPHAMVLSTASMDGQPHSRVVLLRGFDENGFSFYTNFNSDKGKQLVENQKVSITFFWPELERQIRIEGIAKKNLELDSDEYFKTRPRENQIAAWASSQSSEIADRNVLAENFDRAVEDFKNKEIIRPPHWGGYTIAPHLFEFWQGRLSRLHDRISYRLSEDNSWKIKRLSP